MNRPKEAPLSIHMNDALALLADRRAHDLKLWKIETAEMLEYVGVTMIGRWTRGGVVRVRFRNGEIRCFRSIMLCYIDGRSIYL